MEVRREANSTENRVCFVFVFLVVYLVYVLILSFVRSHPPCLVCVLGNLILHLLMGMGMLHHWFGFLYWLLR
jgi:hypothetical protein